MVDSTQFNTFEKKFAALVSRQVYNYMPIALLQNCQGCRQAEEDPSLHFACQMPPSVKFAICFQDVMNLIDKEQIEEQFRTYVRPRPDFVYTQSWYQNLWSNQDWLQLVEYKAVQLEGFLQNEE